MAITLTDVPIVNFVGTSQLEAFDLSKILSIRVVPKSRTNFIVQLQGGTAFTVVSDIAAIEALLGITLTTNYKNAVIAQAS